MKNEFTVFFELFGKKMKTTVMAVDEAQAREIVKNSINIHKVEKTKDEFNECVDMLKEASEIIGNKTK